MLLSSSVVAQDAPAFIVLYGTNAIPTNASAAIASSGGTVVAAYDAIGVVVARSASATFRTQMLTQTGVVGVSATGGLGVQLRSAADQDNTAAPTSTPASDSDTLSSLQWDMRQIHTPEAHAITGGSPTVVVGDLDSGLDYTHPDLAPNVDFGNSVSCVGGVPDQNPAAWDDTDGHGTHTAGTIAAASNGIGIVGVAPHVRIAGVKVGNADGFFYPEAVVCAFMWAATHHFDVVNNSYFADPWLFNCRNDPAQRAIWEAERRAIRYAMSHGVTVVASAGNDNFNLAKSNTDTISPDDTTPVTRQVTNACAIVPGEIPGVITVSANGNLQQKSYYSSYGVGVVELVAPGGDRRFQRTSAAPDGRVLSAYPAKFFFNSPVFVRDCSVSPCAVYAYLQGTSMAAPHVTGVAALAISQFGKMSPGAVASILTGTADATACPPNPFDPGGTGSFIATCTGGTGYNGFYGFGQVNALSAVTGTR
jgi:subtilisin family serine protease